MGRGFIKHRPERPVEAATEAQWQVMNAKLAARSKVYAVSGELYKTGALSFGQLPDGAKPSPTAAPIKGRGSSAPTRDVHVSGGVGDSHTNAGVTPVPCLLWTWGDDEWTILSTDGRYLIRKHVVTASGVRCEAIIQYRCYRRVLEWDALIASEASQEAAQEACEAHARESKP